MTRSSDTDKFFLKIVERRLLRTRIFIAFVVTSPSFLEVHGTNAFVVKALVTAESMSRRVVSGNKRVKHNSGK